MQGSRNRRPHNAWCKSRHLNEHVFERRICHTPVSDTDALAGCLHLREDLLGCDAADGDAATQRVTDKRIGHGT